MTVLTPRRRGLLAFAAAWLSLLAWASESRHAAHSVPAHLAPQSLLLDGVAIDGRLVAVGERGHILVSDDGGLSWRQCSVPTRSTLTGVFFFDREQGWAVGHDSVIVRTTDGGASWRLVHAAPEDGQPLLDVLFLDDLRGFAVGAYGLFLKTSDGGERWEHGTVDEEYDYHLNRIVRSDDGRLTIAAEAGNIYRSEDEGESWVGLASPYEGSFFGVLPLEGEALLLAGLRGHLFRSEDAGLSWRQLETTTTSLLSDVVRIGGALVVTGSGGTLLVSRDGGQGYSLETRPDRQAIATALPAGDGAIVLVGEHGVSRLDTGEIGIGAAP